SLGLICVEQRLRRLAPHDHGELPTEIIGIAEARIHALPAERAVDVSRIAGEQDPPLPVSRGQTAVKPEYRSPPDVADPGFRVADALPQETMKEIACRLLRKRATRLNLHVIIAPKLARDAPDVSR